MATFVSALMIIILALILTTNLSFMAESAAIFPMFYLPPVAYFTELLRHQHNFLIENSENFPKQTYRNRAHIYSPNGVLPLVVPVSKGSKNHTKVKDVRISYDFRWQRQHWMSLETCYRRSAYFEFYEDDFAAFYRQKQYDFLFDLNEALLLMLLKLLKMKMSLEFTTAYRAEVVVDFRSNLQPKTPYAFEQKPYYQVFEDRKLFLPNLSIVDLLFSQGPNSLNFF